MSDSIIKLNDDNSNEVFSDTSPIIIDFWAPWCSPCKMLAATMEDIAKDYKGRVRVAKVNVEEAAGKISAKYGISALPTIVIINKDGQMAKKMVGLSSKQEISKAIDQAIS